MADLVASLTTLTDHSAGLLLLALGFEWLVGEPPSRWHPVVWVGTVIGWGRAIGLRLQSKVGQFLWGLLLAVVLPSVTAWTCHVALQAILPLAAKAGRWGELLVAIAAAWLLKATFSLRLLGSAARRVGEALSRGELAEGRSRLTWLCSRDPSQLAPEQVAGAAVASVAENLSDSFVAPLFWYAVLGLPGAVFYRVANTMDAMLGYRGELEWLGKAPARLDDLLNWLPARITAMFLLVGGALSALPSWQAAKVAWRDHRRTPSPNGGWPMATMAGLLDLRLEKVGCYQLHEAGHEAEAPAIDRAWRLAMRAAWLAVVCLLATTLIRRAPFE